MRRGLALLSSGFVLAILWMDLKFERVAWEAVQSGGLVSAEGLEILTAYYTRVTTTEAAGPTMIGIMTLILILATLAQLIDGRIPLWSRIAALGLMAPPVGLGILVIFPGVGRMSTEVLSHADQTAIATSILQAHLYCFVSIGLFILLHLWISYRVGRS